MVEQLAVVFGKEDQQFDSKKIYSPLHQKHVLASILNDHVIPQDVPSCFWNNVEGHPKGQDSK
jgi:hypothetical protein